MPSRTHGSARQTRNRILRLQLRDGPDCQLCHTPIDFDLPLLDKQGASVDHKRPLAAGGQNVFANWQLAHRVCNSRKGSRWNGVDYCGLNSEAPPYGIGKHYRRASQRRFNIDPTVDSSDWDTPVLPCWP